MENNTIPDDEHVKRIVREQLRRSRITAIVLGVASVISISLFVFAQIQRIEANRSHQLAIQLQNELENQKALAEQNRLMAIRNEQIAKANELNAQKALEECQKGKK
jgi:hypothetical protein